MSALLSMVDVSSLGSSVCALLSMVDASSLGDGVCALLSMPLFGFAEGQQNCNDEYSIRYTIVVP